MVTATCCATGFVVTRKGTPIAPSGTVTFAGTVAAAGLLLERVTVAPPGGAGPPRLTYGEGSDALADPPRKELLGPWPGTMGNTKPNGGGGGTTTRTPPVLVVP